MERMRGGHCFGGVAADGDAGGPLLRSVVDPDRVFGEYPDPSRAWAFEAERPYDAAAPQGVHCQTCCGFVYRDFALAPDARDGIASCWTTLRDDGEVDLLCERLLRPGWFDACFAEAERVTRAVMDRAFLASGSAELNRYLPQTFLDNSLRGGLPLSLPVEGRSPVVLHVFNRKHGDLERDYNFFSLAPTYFSQGNGNFRDVNQNRRSDVWFNPDVREANIRYFANLIQPDGYNPLVCKGVKFVVRDSARARDCLLAVLPPAGADRVLTSVGSGFAPGALFGRLETERAAAPDRGAFLAGFLAACDIVEDAEFGEGYWIDHWFYLLDQIESFLAIYPERRADLLRGQRDLTWFESPVRVLNRDEKHVLCRDGMVRQVDAVAKDERKAGLIARRATFPNLARDGAGRVYRSTLLQKLVAVVVTRLASFSPSGLGLDMEAGRPGWHDSINGLPGIFGSSTSEQFQLRRLIEFLLESLPRVTTAGDRPFALPIELEDLRRAVVGALARYETDEPAARDFHYWDGATGAKERYRAKIRDGFDGAESDLPWVELESFLRRGLRHVCHALDRAVDPASGLPLTYYRHKPVAWEPVLGADGQPERYALGTRVRVTRFEVRALPLFLEGVLHAMRAEGSGEVRREIYRRLRASPLYDRALGMYLVGDNVKAEGPEVGRIWAWSPGWFENENVFLHAEHKYILNCMLVGLYEEAWSDFRACALPFQPMDRLGRNPLENASFIMSSRQPKPAYVGRGYQPRSSGTTAEVLEFMLVAMFGERPFRVDGAGRLTCVLEPRLPAWMFTERAATRRQFLEGGATEEVAVPAGGCAALFLGRCLVIYENPRRQATFGPGAARVAAYRLRYADGREREIVGSALGPEHATALRAGQVTRLFVSLR
jgi:hypothetical protein